MPSASRVPAVMLTLTIAPPAVIGRSEAAAPKQRTTRASVGEKATPSEASKPALPSARVVQQPSRKQPAAIAERVVEAERRSMRPAALCRRACRRRYGNWLRRGPAASTPQAPTPKRTTKISGGRRLAELVAVAEIESGREGAASAGPGGGDRGGEGPRGSREPPRPRR